MPYPLILYSCLSLHRYKCTLGNLVRWMPTHRNKVFKVGMHVLSVPFAFCSYPASGFKKAIKL